MGKSCLPSPRWKGGLEGRGGNRQPSMPRPRAERWCVCRLHPSHLSATLKPDYSRLMSARQGPATRCSRIPSLRGHITPACTGPFRVGFMGCPGRRWPRASTLSPTRCLLRPLCPGETSLHQPLRDSGGCQEVAVPRPAEGCELPGVTAVSQVGALGATMAHGHHGFIGHPSHAAPGGVSPGPRRR